MEYNGIESSPPSKAVLFSQGTVTWGLAVIPGYLQLPAEGGNSALSSQKGVFFF